MKLSVWAFSITAAIIWCAAVLFVGLINLSSPEYGAAFLAVVASVYPGYDVEPNIGSVLIGSAYALVDGLVSGLLFALIYNGIAACCCRREPKPAQPV